MSRVGKKTIKIPSGCTVTISDTTVTVKGSKGELKYDYPVVHVQVSQEGDLLSVTAKDTAEAARYHGLARSILANMVKGVSEGFVKKLTMHGVGYRAQLSGTKLVLSLGFSHPVEVVPPQGIVFEMDQEDKNAILIKGFDKELVGQIASNIRGHKPPEPYKGKGIKYVDEHIIRKAGKSASK